MHSDFPNARYIDIIDVSSTSIGTSVPSSGIRTEIATAYSCGFVVGGALPHSTPPLHKSGKTETQETERKRKININILIA
jgi:hypothetical protein